ncbi:caspase family protein [Sulfurimonas sp.]|nr:caspase family protein [Sulfurimonas sp.]
MLKLLAIILLTNSLLLSNYDDRALKFKKDYNHEQRVALVVGNNEYKSFSVLKNPINDARSIRDILKEKFFDVIYLENTSQKQFKKSIKLFTKKLSLGGVGLFYFAGHGIQVEGENYLIPKDAEIADKDDVDGESVSISYLTNKLEVAGNRLNIIILDACRNDPFTRGVGGGLAPVHARGTYIAYATEAGKTAKDGKGDHGIFTKYLIKYMDESIPLDEVFRKTRKSVYEDTNGEQFPGVYNQVIDGEFFFSISPNNKLKKNYNNSPEKKKTLNSKSNYKPDYTFDENNYLEDSSGESKFVKNFLKKQLLLNKQISNIKVDILNKVNIDNMKPWKAYVTNIKAILQDNRDIEQTMMYFSNGKVVIDNLIDPETGKSYKDLLSPSFKKEYYKKENLIYGNENAKHKVAIFSDPLCPFCRGFVPTAINFMKKDPESFALYYYHKPLPSLHPASVLLVKAAIALELKGGKDVVLNLYKVKVDAKETSINKILREFNKVMNSSIKESDLTKKSIMNQYNSDLNIASALMVQGTPTVFLDGILDKTKVKYKEAD